MDDTVKILRYMEWERVKGSLQAILASYQTDEEGTYAEAKIAIDRFIRRFGEASGID